MVVPLFNRSTKMSGFVPLTMNKPRSQRLLSRQLRGCQPLMAPPSHINSLILGDNFISKPNPTIPHKNIETNDKFYRKVAFLMYTEMVKFRSQSRETALKRKLYRGLGTRYWALMLKIQISTVMAGILIETMIT